MVEYVFSNIFVQKILKTKSNLLQKNFFFMRIGKSFDLKLHQIQQIFIVQENFILINQIQSNPLEVFYVNLYHTRHNLLSAQYYTVQIFACLIT